MKTRKQQTLRKKRADHRPTKRSAVPRRPAAARGKAKSATSRQRRVHADGSLTLAAQCTVAEAESLKSELARRLDESGPVTLDVSALQRIDTAALQLLAAFVRDRRTAGRAVEWRGKAAALDTAAGLLGLNVTLELPGEVGR
ncbi:MAG: STAS domain-containing protein [Gammaproteobacteria bacterium]|nr:STAS domain-containing protein [Gammaproteobacteria bacterium]MDE2262382.1 STAS domain-containing protein [Gammaproteobacteria bacterium]